MSFLLDADTCSFHLRKRVLLTSRLIQYSGRLSISTVAIGELFAWAHLAPNPTVRMKSIQELMQDLSVLDFDVACAAQFGELRTALNRQGLVASTSDLMIASVALVHDLTLVTHNTVDFQSIPGLRLDDWV